MEVKGAWSREGVADYLNGTTVPLRLACHTSGGQLWMLSLWYRHRDGVLECATGADADVVAYLRADPTVAFEVSTNEPPYKGVRGRGRAHIEPDEGKELLESLLVRYLGGTDNDLATKLLSAEREEVRIRIDPEKLYSWDFTERMADIDA